MYDKIKNGVLFNEIRRMCLLLSKYDKSSFNSAASDDEMIRFEQTALLVNNIKSKGESNGFCK